jgi:hypothetical protein
MDPRVQGGIVEEGGDRWRVVDVIEAKHAKPAGS